MTEDEEDPTDVPAGKGEQPEDEEEAEEKASVSMEELLTVLQLNWSGAAVASDATELGRSKMYEFKKLALSMFESLAQVLSPDNPAAVLELLQDYKPFLQSSILFSEAPTKDQDRFAQVPVAVAIALVSSNAWTLLFTPQSLGCRLEVTY
jgi:hypothetical protein